MVSKLEFTLAAVLAAALAVGTTLRSLPRSGPAARALPHDARMLAETGPLHTFPLAEARSSDAPPAPPLALTASDGTGLTLASLDARGLLQGPLAFTELRLTFQNPEDRTLEGTFRITLPPGAVLSRFAMKQGSQWQEGEVVEKQAARQAYEDFLHRRQDPALLEQAAGNEFSARVFPIPARGQKELIVSYSHAVSPDLPYKMPLRGLPRVGRLDAVVTRSGDDAPVVGQVHLREEAPGQDLVVEPSRMPAGDGLRAGDLAVLRVRAAAAAGEDLPQSVLILVDTSASRALGFAQQVALVSEVVKGLPTETPLLVGAFDQGADVIYQGAAGRFSGAKLRERQAFGASDLEGALAWAGEMAQRQRLRRLVLVTDGVPTAGATEGEALQRAAGALGARGIERLDVVAVGGIRDESILRRLVTAKLARDGVVLDGQQPPEVLRSRLRAATRSVDVKVDGAKWQWPERIEGAQPGDEALVYVEMMPGATPRVRLDGQAAPAPQLAAVDRALLERAWAQARIDQLTSHPAAGLSPQAVRAEVVRLSTTHRVLSPYTALLVLESESDYARYKIDRKALTDILTIEGTQLVRQRRSDAAIEPAEQPRAKGDEGNAPQPPATATATAAALPPDALRALRQAEGDAPRRPEPAARDRNVDRPSSPPPPALEAAAEPAPAPARPLERAEESKPAPEKPRAASVQAKKRAPPGDALMNIDDGDIGVSAGSPAQGLRIGPSGGGKGQARSGLADLGSRQDQPGRAAPAAIASAGPGALRREASPEALAPPSSYTGVMADVMSAIQKGDRAAATERAIAYWQGAPGDVVGLLALGEAFEASGEARSAARTYGSILDLFPARADLRRMAAGRLERIGNPYSLLLAADAHAKAVEQRPDHPSSHRMLAYARLRAGDLPGAFDAIEAGASRSYPAGRFRGADRILREDMGLIGAAWLRADASRRDEIERRLAKVGAWLETAPSLRFVLTWETDANDVDFHIHDSKGGHAYFSSRRLPSGGELYADVTMGYGPECFTVPLPASERSGPYRLQAHYYSRGPMGYGMGKLEVIDHDGQGQLVFEERPFIVMKDRAYVDLGVYPAVAGAVAPSPTAP